MRIEYIRNLMSSYMVADLKGEVAEWERQMILHSRIESVLFAENTEENGEKKLWYDITGKQGLDIVLEKAELKAGLLCRILGGLYESAEKLGAYLLEPDALLLHPECIFMDSGTEQIYFCYYPGNEEKGEEAFRKLMEYLLTKIDHGDSEAVEMAYGLYGQAGKEGFGLRELRGWIRLPYAREELQGNGTVMEVQKDDEHCRGQKREEKNVAEEPPASKRLFGRMTELFTKMFVNKVLKKIRQRKAETEEFVFEPDEENEVPISRPTILLSDIKRPVEGILRYEGSGICTDLKISGVPYIIGSGDFCDGRIRSDTVSRKHARITRVDEIYFIEDLNSANGTYVGGELLNYKVKMSLEKNEMILFANEKFRFI